MKLLLLSTILLSLVSPPFQNVSQAQKISNQEWESLFSALEKEDWKGAAVFSKQYLDRLKTDDSRETRARLRYMLLFSYAGQVTRGEMSYDELSGLLSSFSGAEVQLPHSRIIRDCRGNLGAICLPSTGNYDVSVASTNNKGTYIHAFVYVKLQEKFDVEAHLEKIGTVRGIVDSIQLNPNQSKVWIMRVFLKNGAVVLEQ